MINYFFTKVPGGEFNYYTLTIIAAVALILGSFAFRIIYKKRVANRDFVFKKMFKKVPSRLVYFSITLLFLILVRYEKIPFFSMRFWLYSLLLGFLAMTAFYVYKYLKVYPKELENFEARGHVTEETKTVYLPGKRRK